MATGKNSATIRVDIVDFSAVTHIAKDKGIPPFLTLHVAEHPDTTAQAQRLDAVLRAAGVRANSSVPATPTTDG